MSLDSNHFRFLSFGVGISAGSVRRCAAICAIAVLALGLAACGGAEEREAAYFERGKEFFDNGDLTKARLEFRNARQINPLNMEALYYLGLIAERQQNLDAARRAYRSVIDQEPEHIGANLRLGRIHLLMGDVDQTSERAETVIALEPDNAEALALRAAVMLRRGAVTDAQIEASKALQIDPGSTSAVAVLVGVLERQGKREEALALLDQAIERTPNEASLRILQIQLYREAKDIPAIERVYTSLFEMEPRNYLYRVDLARILLVEGRRDDAERVLRDAIEKNPKDDRPKLLLVDFFSNQFPFQDAEQEIRKLIAENPHNTALKFALAHLYVHHNQPDRAEVVLDEIVQRAASKPDAIRAKAGLARLRFAAGDVAEAHELVKAVLAEDSTNSDALLTRARLAMLEGNTTEGVTDLRRVIRDDPSSKEALELLANAHLRAGELDLAIENMRRLVVVDPMNDAVRLQLARLLGQQGNHSHALAILDQSLPQVVESENGLSLRVDLLISQGRFNEAMEAARRLYDVGTRKEIGLIAIGRVHQAEGRHQEAVDAFAQALEAAPAAPAALSGLVRSYLALDRGRDAVDYLDKVAQKSPDDAFVHNLLGEVYAVQKANEKAEKSFLEATARQADWSLPYVNLAQLLIEGDQPDRAVVHLKRGLKRLPDDQLLLFAYATAQYRANDIDSAQKTYEKMLERNPAHDAAANNLAALLADYRYKDSASLDKALQLAQRFQNSTNAFYLDTLGWVHYRRGDMNLALLFLSRAVEAMPDHPYLNYHLGMAYYNNGQLSEARTHLEKAVVDSASYPEVEQARALLASM